MHNNVCSIQILKRGGGDSREGPWPYICRKNPAAYVGYNIEQE